MPVVQGLGPFFVVAHGMLVSLVGSSSLRVHWFCGTQTSLVARFTIFCFLHFSFPHIDYSDSENLF